MTTTDAELLKGKFDDLMQAVENFGMESQQLTQARKGIKELVTGVQATNESLLEVAVHCQEYLDTADRLISDGFTQQINKDIAKASDIVLQCQQQCEELTAQYREILSSFAADADQWEERQNAVTRAVQEAASANESRSAALARQTEQGMAAIQSALEQKAAQLEEQQKDSVKEIVDAAKAEVRKYAEDEQEALSAEAARLSGKLAAIGGSVEQLERSVNRGFSEKAEYLEEKQQECTLEILEAIQNLDKRADQLTAANAKLETLITKQLTAHQAQNTQLIEGLAAQVKRQQMLMLVGFGVLAVLAVLGLFI